MNARAIKLRPSPHHPSSSSSPSFFPCQHYLVISHHENVVRHLRAPPNRPCCGHGRCLSNSCYRHRVGSRTNSVQLLSYLWSRHYHYVHSTHYVLDHQVVSNKHCLSNIWGLHLRQRSLYLFESSLLCPISSTLFYMLYLPLRPMLGFQAQWCRYTTHSSLGILWQLSLHIFWGRMWMRGSLPYSFLQLTELRSVTVPRLWPRRPYAQHLAFMWSTISPSM